MEPSQTLKNLRCFIGEVNYYKDMWPQWSHVLAPLTVQVVPTKFKWTPEMQTAFNNMKARIQIIMNPSASIDAGDYQLGACTIQEGRPVSYYLRKVDSTQRNYTLQEKELLSVVMTLKEFRSMLLGVEFHIYTDHVNNTFETL
ncbi:hypothetical protein ACHAWF_011468 [Thalassiosira exigua]